MNIVYSRFGTLSIEIHEKVQKFPAYHCFCKSGDVVEEAGRREDKVDWAVFSALMVRPRLAPAAITSVTTNVLRSSFSNEAVVNASHRK